MGKRWKRPEQREKEMFLTNVRLGHHPNFHLRQGRSDMSDFTPRYIKMCKTCGLPWTPEVGDWIVRKSGLTSPHSIFVVGEVDKDVEIVRAVNIKDGNWIAFNPSCFIPLWSQEQLWRKLDYTLQEQLDCIGGHRSDEKSLYNLFGTGPFNSFSQLLLALVMQELHNKKWTDERWEAIG